jgi:hypothetical protein
MMRCDGRRRAVPGSGARRTFAAFRVMLLLALGALPAAAEKYQSDEWVTECGVGPETGARECTITVPFQEREKGGKGAFALVVALSSGDLAVVGEPFPLRAELRVDGNPAIECKEPRYCLFARGDSRAVLDELRTGSVILIDVFTAKTAFRASLTARGYRAGIAQIRAWGYPLAGE